MTQDNLNIAKRLAVVFPGQGSQTVGMMNELAESFESVRKAFDEASAALGFDLWEVTQDESRLNKTEYTQPALLVSSVAIWQIIEPMLAKQSLKPLYLAGHSLGEYSALVASGVLSLGDAAKLVHERGKLMTAAVKGMDTQMAAVLGLEDEQVASLCEEVSSSTGVVNAANFNSPGQVVVAGTAVGVAGVLSAVEGLGKKAVPLKVSVPSHCQLMNPASDALAELLNATQFNEAKIAVIQNRHAKVHTDIADIKLALTEQLSMPVQWSKTMQKLADQEIELVIECGPGNVLSNLAKRQATPITALPTDKLARLEKLENLA
ncbi:ACP S-malonyltransferase [Moraxella sp. FZLJ2107]|uniref:ACP S-malonyltransferase n=1 Tax=unclassified Moraxella TaxID=2685852 RepID=UPI0020C8C634|nr:MULTISPECIES: ACP S-malonyltransferase [unclassified Moraxella]UTO04742.1 ACP S-malonyltransferase [Moraxella sp. FZLJ2107]UTO21470.1 ACP S-malonyltransferase [Moraxella sp. FZLJ2109]